MGDATVDGGRTAYRASDWTQDALLERKGDHTISVVIPAKDEEATVGEVVTRILADFVADGGAGLVDEVVVIDSDSTDATAAVARDAGAKVFSAKDIRPDLGAAFGKGEALWKSQFVTSGDLVAFVDADLIDWGTHFVTGLLAPLLVDQGVHLVKAVYDRPMIDADGREEETGGRVTELVARPWLALHRPGLAGVVQPLSGEWAIRRESFASYAVPVGYGVEIAALLDTADRFGVEAVAQVDLGRRTHRHHRHDTLGLMAVQVLAAAERRRDGAESGARAGMPELDMVPLRQFVRGAEGFEPRETAVAVSERPPAASVRMPSVESR
ncbi:glucosyl-3-phosphoglycerate synthase [Knoellia sinensis KCTC 19936]|uniref:Glucosyl-3-phosphoglycerate synthase n=1 Tax=Knoellia sinensis KCTC 19936 TaxID=1385520 RepID=A0A0A0JBT3_9MICO|nr:glucosyl-3-phosphoglycerate synthase [Knoellia sinensis]KGN34274.1 glucosyl-3-phosphoglycerate synthase [Knoellia sinensis KCTC 19936]